MANSRDLDRDLLSLLVPRLRRFAVCICGNRGIADECVERALAVTLKRFGDTSPCDLETCAFASTRIEVRSWKATSNGQQVCADETIPSLRADAAFRSLNIDHREVLILRITEGLTLEQVAQILGFTPDDVIGRLKAARTAYDRNRSETSILPMSGSTAHPHSRAAE